MLASAYGQALINRDDRRDFIHFKRMMYGVKEFDQRPAIFPHSGRVFPAFTDKGGQARAGFYTGIRDEDSLEYTHYAGFRLILKRMLDNFGAPVTVVVGTIKLVLFDDREGSSTHAQVEEIFLGGSNYALVKVPPMVWNGFKGVGAEPAIVANCATIPHDPSEIEGLDPLAGKIPYDWRLKHR